MAGEASARAWLQRAPAGVRCSAKLSRTAWVAGSRILVGVLLVLRKRKGNSICFCADPWLTTSFSWRMISKLWQIQGPHAWRRGPCLWNDPRGCCPWTLWQLRSEEGAVLVTTFTSQFISACASLLTPHMVPTACWRCFLELFLPPERCVGCCGYHRPRLTSLSI